MKTGVSASAAARLNALEQDTLLADHLPEVPTVEIVLIDGDAETGFVDGDVITVAPMALPKRRRKGHNHG